MLKVILTLVLLVAFNSQPASAETCIASVYSIADNSPRNSSITASGIPLNDGKATVAHKSYPLRSNVRVTGANGSGVFRVTDRGPFVRGRCVDLSRAAARAIGVSGLGKVTVERVF